MTRLGTFQGKTTRTSLPRESFRPLLATALSYPLSSLFHLFPPSKKGSPSFAAATHTPHRQHDCGSELRTTGRRAFQPTTTTHQR